MTTVNSLFEQNFKMINIGLESFYNDLNDQNVDCVHVQWRPPSLVAKNLANF